jgi:hypothetical protein
VKTVFEIEENIRRNNVLISVLTALLAVKDSGKDAVTLVINMLRSWDMGRIAKLVGNLNKLDGHLYIVNMYSMYIQLCISELEVENHSLALDKQVIEGGAESFADSRIIYDENSAKAMYTRADIERILETYHTTTDAKTARKEAIDSLEYYGFECLRSIDYTLLGEELNRLYKNLYVVDFELDTLPA